MSGPDTNPALLFPPSPLTSLSSLPLTKTVPSRQFFIEIPSLLSVDKELYKGGELIDEYVDFEAKDLDKVIGEYQKGTQSYYYARFRDGIAHKVVFSRAVYFSLL